MTYLTHVAHGVAFDLSEWSFDFGELDPVIGKSVCEAVRNTLLAPDAIGAALPFTFGHSDGIGGPGPDDPTTVDIDLPFGRDEGVTFRFSVQQLVASNLDMIVDEPETSAALRDGFLAIATLIQKACFPHEDMPEIDRIAVPAHVLNEIDLGSLWWDANDNFIAYLDREIEMIATMIDRLRANKVALEAAKHHHLSRRNEGSSSAQTNITS